MIRTTAAFLTGPSVMGLMTAEMARMKNQTSVLAVTQLVGAPRCYSTDFVKLLNRDLSKYLYKIMCLLVHQKCSLSEKEAFKEFFGMFINTKGLLFIIQM